MQNGCAQIETRLDRIHMIKQDVAKLSVNHVRPVRKFNRDFVFHLQPDLRLKGSAIGR